MTHILDSAEAIPQAVPRTGTYFSVSSFLLSIRMLVPLVSNISGVQPYKIAHIICIEVHNRGGKMEAKKLTVEHRLKPIELSMTAHLDVTLANIIQNNAVMNELPANDHLRPSLDSVMYAPTYPTQDLSHCDKGGQLERQTREPGHPPSVKNTTSHRLVSSVCDSFMAPRISSNFGR